MLAMTFGMMYALGIDLQQVPTSLIIALAWSTQTRKLRATPSSGTRHGYPPIIAEPGQPTKLRPRLYGDEPTNDRRVSPAPLPGDTGPFLYSLACSSPCSLVASRSAIRSFRRAWKYFTVKARNEPTLQERCESGFALRWRAARAVAIAHR